MTPCSEPRLHSLSHCKPLPPSGPGVLTSRDPPGSPSALASALQPSRGPLPSHSLCPSPSLFLECPLLVQIHHSLPYIFQVFDEMSLFRESFPDYPTSNCNPTPSLITLYPPPLFYLFFFPQRIDQLLKYCETYFLKISSSLGFPGGSAVKTPPANAGHVGHIPNR